MDFPAAAAKAAAASKVPCLLLMAVVACLCTAATALTPSHSTGPTLRAESSFWHYSISDEGSKSIEVVWAALPGAGPPASYVIQRWPTTAVPEPGQEGYLASVINLGPIEEHSDGTFSAMHNFEAAGDGPRSFYRLLALAGSGRVLAATRPSQPVSTKGSIFVSAAPCSRGACRTLLAQQSIQAAMDASAQGTTVNVLPGTYMGIGNTNLVFRGKPITLQAVAGPDATVIDCQSSARAFLFTAEDGPGTQVKGFRVINGAADIGGCAVITDGSPTLSDCVFQRCSAKDGLGLGGAIYIGGETARPLIRGSAFLDNSCAYSGGGIYVKQGGVEVQQCRFERNAAGAGIGMGGAIMFDNSKPSVVSDTLMSKGSCGFSGGAISAQVAQEVRLVRVRAVDNYSGSFAGAFLVWGSTVIISDSEVSNNTAELFGGGVHAQYGMYNATNTRHNGNAAVWGGGGGIKLLSAVGLLKNCQVNGNRASYGGAIEVMVIGQTDVGIQMPTIISVNDSAIAGNVVTDRGAAFHIESADLAAFINVTISNNVAATTGGGGWCSNSRSPLQLVTSRVHNNTAATGGGLFARAPCNAVIVGSEFQQNSASQYGGAIAAGDGSSLNISRSTFVKNGLSNCKSIDPPLGGGAIYVGVPAFAPSAQCGAQDTATLAFVKLDTVSLTGNVASDRGGAVHVAAGHVDMQNVELAGNVALGLGNSDGVGGAIALDERCSDGLCSPVTAQLTKLKVTANTAQMAGGGIYYNGSSVGSSLTISESLFAGNQANVEQQGVGGGLYIGRSNFSIAGTMFVQNTAYYGGGMFLSADLSVNAVLAYLNLTANAAQMGSAAFWLRSKSPVATLACEGCAIQPLGPDAIATEVLSMRYGDQPPSVVQTNENFPRFAVNLLDYYGNVMRTEKGVCRVSATSAAAAITSRGSEEYTANGTADFAALQLKGTINQSYSLLINFDRLTGRASKFLAANSLEPLPLPVTIGSCPAGSAPTSQRDDCAECSPGTFSLDGMQCQTCPRGADCQGGNKVYSRADFWRSGNASAQFFMCRNPGVCLPGPQTGDQACAHGQQGPLCDVCWDGYYKFKGQCRICAGSGQAKAMLAVTVVLFALAVLALFARNWDFGHGPGIMTKIKILLTHFQMISLFRDYDVMWPGATDAAMGWFEVLNVGFSMLAPECFFGSGYNFYAMYIVQMSLPFVCVSACVAAYYLAELALRRLDPTGQVRAQGAAAPGVVGWLEGLKLRCWKNAFWFVTLLYPRCAMTALQLFGWQKLDSGTYLKADFSLMVKTVNGSFVGTYIKYLVPGILLLIVFALVIPTFWFVTVYLNRHKLDDPLVQVKYGFLYSSYSPRHPYWETTEMLRKFAIAFIPVFVPTQADGSLQAAVAQVVLLLYIMLTLKLWPFALSVDNWLQLASLTVLWLLLLSSGVNKWADLSGSGSRALAACQLVLSSGVGFLLCSAIVLSGIGIVRRYAQKRRAKRQAAAAAAAGGGDPEAEQGGGQPGGLVCDSKRFSACISSKRGSVFSAVGGSSFRGPDIRAVGGGIGSTTGGAGGKAEAEADGSAGLPRIRVTAGLPQDHHTSGDGDQLSPLADDQPPSRRKLLRTSSSMSRRSAADDAEMRLPVDGVQRSDSSTLLPRPIGPATGNQPPALPVRPQYQQQQQVQLLWAAAGGGQPPQEAAAPTLSAD